KTAQAQATRTVRDQRELAAGGGAGDIRLGAHAFTVNRQPIDLTLVAHEENGQPALAWQITGTDYLAPAHDERLNALRPYWGQHLASETGQLARAEYLAAEWLDALQTGQVEPGWDELLVQLAETPADAAPPAALLEPLRRFAAARYQEGYQRGIHDDDALAIVRALAPMQAAAGLLIYSPAARALALLLWTAGLPDDTRQMLARRARAGQRMAQLFSAPLALDALAREAHSLLAAFLAAHPGLADELCPSGQPGQQDADRRQACDTLCAEAAAYLVRELGASAHETGADETLPGAPVTWVVSGSGQDLAAALERALDHGGQHAAWQRDLQAASPLEAWRTARQWALAFALSQAPASAQEHEDRAARLASVDDAATCLACAAPRRRINAARHAHVTGLRSEHPRIENGTLTLDLNNFWLRVRHHRQHALPGYQALQALRHDLLAQERTRLHLAQFQAKPLSTFVRNRLIDEVYLPLIGANLAKQIGAAGEASRSDRSGLLLLISPPGYGKTTLMEYVADRLGLVFVRINCPALGHGVTSIDPATAPNSAARQELEKLNLGLAMGSNVMLYLDDIQHTHPEFLQKFIALADGTRRIEGVWQGQSRTWDMRGKRFAIVMAGNPYTESGEVFRIPDMLANRADIYNLGDVLSGREAVFALSYIENSLTSHPVTQPLAARDPRDVPLLVRMAQGEAIDPAELAHPYSAAELDEIKNLLQRLMDVRDVLLKVNQAYIQSAAQDDRYRQAPPFKLQGSYRNMARLAPQVTPLMTPQDIASLLRDHYRGEAQTLTTGAEENLLQLAHLTGQPTPEESARWQQIEGEYRRQRQIGGADDDPSVRVTRGLLDISRSLEALNPEKTLDRLARQFNRGNLLIARPLATLARQLGQPPAPSPESQALVQLAQHLQDGNAAAQTRLREALDASAAALKAVQDSTQALTQHSDRAQEQRMVDALLSLSVTYRQLIMPLVRAVESRMGTDAQMHQQIEALEQEIERLQP
ncbi:MAG: AAA family ATPase, partial [Comamonadaceae bacterium]|nr:AAA family ATPase [Comamonadaceae bacterium]